MKVPGHAVNDGPLYHFPFVQVFHPRRSRTPRSARYRAARRLPGLWRDAVGAMGLATIDDPDALIGAAEAASGIDEMKLVLHRNFDLLMERTKRGETLTQAEALQFRYQCSAVPDRCVDSRVPCSRAAAAAGLYRPRHRPLLQQSDGRAQHGSNNAAAMAGSGARSCWTGIRRSRRLT